MPTPDQDRPKLVNAAVAVPHAVSADAVLSGTVAVCSRRKLMPLAVLLLAGTAVLAALAWPSGSSAEAAPPVQPVTVVRAFPHDATAFCQGLVVHNGQLLEGTGQYAQSRLRHVDLESGQSLREVRLDDRIFGEGITVWQDQILQLTWKNGFLLRYDAGTLQSLGSVPYRDIDPGLREGWGITQDGRHLIISDGSATLRFVDPATFRLVRTVVVKNGWRSLSQLNELEYVDGQILANVWYRDDIARIDPATGVVLGWLDLSAIKPREIRRNREAVLNGIAWDSDNRRLFVTGKNWPKLFEIRLPDLDR